MKVSIIGYGKMGKEVIKLARERGHEVVDIFDIDNINEMNVEKLKKADVVFEFTTPDVAFDNISICMDAGVPCVSGTTGWLDKLDLLKLRCNQEGRTLFYSSNFSIGVNILFRINRILAKIMNKYPDYDVRIEETHHIHKLDAPSGTAINIAQQIIDELDRKNDWKLNASESDVINVVSHREGEIPGIHEVIYESDIDIISIKHSAKNRRGLALGAVLAAEFVKDKNGFFTMDDLLKF